MNNYNTQNCKNTHRTKQCNTNKKTAGVNNINLRKESLGTQNNDYIRKQATKGVNNEFLDALALVKTASKKLQLQYWLTDNGHSIVK